MFDDVWLDTLIKITGEANEFIDGREKYKTILKQFDDFFDFDELVFKKFKKFVPKLKGLVKKAKYNENAEDIVNNVSTLLNNLSEEHLNYVMNEVVILFTNVLLGILERMFATNDSLLRKEPISLFQKYIYGSKKNVKYNDDSIFLGALDFNTGFPNNPGCKLWKPGKSKLIFFENYSSIEAELEFEKGLLPPFHLYKNIESSISDEKCLDDLSLLFVQFTIEHISNFFTREC